MKLALFVIIVAAGAVSAGSLHAQDVDDPVLGTWKLNLSKSKYIPGPAPRSQTRVYRQTPNGIFVTIETIAADGRKQPTIEFAEKYDGKEYPIKGSDIG